MLPAKKIFFQVATLFLLIGLIVFIILKYFRPSIPSSLSQSSFLSKIFPSASAPAPSPSPLPSPRPIPHGAKGFTVGQSDKTVPQFSKGSIDPYDPAPGATQTVTINVKHSQPITKITAVLKTDNASSQPYSFKLVKGSDTNGEWQGSWQVEDTYLYTYALTLNAASASDPASVTITLR